jgi:hypothetical protein
VQRTLLSKELRECGLYAGLALLAQMHYLGSGMGLPLIPFIGAERGQEIPFLSYGVIGNRETNFVTIAVISAIVFGLNQTVMESWRQTTLFLLHRPLPRSEIFLTKLAAGALCLLVSTALPLLVYCLWAATPGTHASPFFWGMTETWWRDVAATGVCYLAAFLTGLRPAHWLGSRTWPLIAAAFLCVVLRFVPIWPPLIYSGFFVLAVSLIGLILETARVREYP